MKILHLYWTTFGNKITYWKKWPSRLRVNIKCWSGLYMGIELGHHCVCRCHSTSRCWAISRHSIDYQLDLLYGALSRAHLTVAIISVSILVPCDALIRYSGQSWNLTTWQDKKHHYFCHWMPIVTAAGYGAAKMETFQSLKSSPKVASKVGCGQVMTFTQNWRWIDFLHTLHSLCNSFSLVELNLIYMYIYIIIHP